MKTQKFTSLKAIIRITLMATLLTVAACGSKQESAAVDTTAIAKVNAPQIDIHTAVVTGNIEALKQHISAGSNINEKDPFGGSSPLISASVFGKTEEARVLIDAGADLNFQNNDGSTALHSASFF